MTRRCVDTHLERDKRLLLRRYRSGGHDTARFRRTQAQHNKLSRAGKPMMEMIENQVYLAQGAYAAVIGRSEGLLAMCEAMHYALVALHIRIQTAAAYEMLGKREAKDSCPEAFSSLAPREREIALLITQRLSNREIAEKLFLSEGSVKQYLNQLYAKLSIEGDTRTKRRRLSELAKN